jgi:hypothetical protein
MASSNVPLGVVTRLSGPIQGTRSMPYSGYLDPVMVMKKGFGFAPDDRQADYAQRGNDAVANLLAAIERQAGAGNMAPGPSNDPISRSTRLLNYWTLPREMRNPQPLPQFDPNNGILPGPQD